MAERVGGFKGMLPAKRAAAYLGVCYTSFQKLLKTSYKPKIPRYRIRTRYFFKPEDLDLWIEAHREK